MLKQLHNKNLYLAYRILEYGDLLNFDALNDIRTLKIGNSWIYSIYYRRLSKYNIIYIKNIVKHEKNYINLCFDKNGLRLNFTVPNKYSWEFDHFDAMNINNIYGSRILELNNLLNKKAPATKSS